MPNSTWGTAIMDWPKSPFPGLCGGNIVNFTPDSRVEPQFTPLLPSFTGLFV